MKRLAQEYVQWPEINKQIEEKVKSCNACQTNRNTPELAPLHLWEWPDKPWSRVHVRYAGPFLNCMFLLYCVESLYTEIKMRYTLAFTDAPYILFMVALNVCAARLAKPF